MYSPLEIAVKYLRYRITAANGKGHGMHSPFVFRFITEVLTDKNKYPAYQLVENLRADLSRNMTVLSVDDYGAGSVTAASKQRTIASIARNAAKPAKFGQVLYRMVKYYQPANVLELGTSLGVTSSYLALAEPANGLVTVEGAAAVAAIARQNFEKLQLDNITIAEGNFDDTLGPVIQELPVVDFAFIDGNHRKEPTLRYFEQLLAKTDNNSILVFDDIHWSSEMEQAWLKIKAHPEVRCTIDLFFIGIVFFRKEFKEKQDFSIRF